MCRRRYRYCSGFWTSRSLAKYNGTTPTTDDFLGNYPDAIDGCPFVIDLQQDAAGRRPVVYMPGASETAAAVDKFEGAHQRSFISYPSNVLSHDANRQIGNVYDPRPRGSWKLKAIYANSPDAKRTVAMGDTTVYVQFDVCEPIILSPFYLRLWQW